MQGTPDKGASKWKSPEIGGLHQAPSSSPEGGNDYSGVGEGKEARSRGVWSHTVSFFPTQSPTGLGQDFVFSSELDKKSLWGSSR